MQVVPTGVPQIVLHVADDRVLPVEHIQGPIATNLHVAGTEVLIRRIQNGFHFFREEAGPLLLKLILGHSLKSDHVGDQQVAPVRFRKMRAVQNGNRRYRANPFFIQLPRCSTARHPDVISRSTGAVRCELVAPLVENISVRIGTDREVKIDVKGDRIPFINTGASGAKALHRAPWRFEVFRMENPAGKIELPTGAHGKRIGRVMGVG